MVLLKFRQPVLWHIRTLRSARTTYYLSLIRANRNNLRFLFFSLILHLLPSHIPLTYQATFMLLVLAKLLLVMLFSRDNFQQTCWRKGTIVFRRCQNKVIPFKRCSTFTFHSKCVHMPESVRYKENTGSLSLPALKNTPDLALKTVVYRCTPVTDR